jgi:DNA-binding NarL/FixJ family response regulator
VLRRPQHSPPKHGLKTIIVEIASAGVTNVLARKHVRVEGVQLQEATDVPGQVDGVSRAKGDQLAKLSPREIEILRLLGSGKSLAEIAWMINVSYKTIANNSPIIR